MCGGVGWRRRKEVEDEREIERGWFGSKIFELKKRVGVGEGSQIFFKKNGGEEALGSGDGAGSCLQLLAPSSNRVRALERNLFRNAGIFT